MNIRNSVSIVFYSTVALFLLNGCRSGVEWSKDTPFGKMQKEATKLVENGGLATVGVGVSSNIQTALEKAKLRARTEMAQIIETKIESLRKDFAEEIGENEVAEYNAMFTATTKAIASQVLHGTVPQKVEYRSESGKTTAWVLMVQNPQVVADFLQRQADAQRALYTRFRASEAFAELEEEIERFEEYKRSQPWLSLPASAPPATE